MKNNPTNPFSRDESQTRREAAMPFQKARVVGAFSKSKDGFHTVRIKIYGDEAAYTAPVLPPTIGGAYVPKEGHDVAVAFGESDKPWVVGPWYALDRVEDGEVELPDYEPGEIVLGNESGGTIRIDNDGNIYLNSSSSGDVFIDGVAQ